MGNNPDFYFNEVPTVDKWNNSFTVKQDDILTELNSTQKAALAGVLLTPSVLLAAFSAFTPAQTATLISILGITGGSPGSGSSPGSLNLGPINVLTVAALF